MFGRAVWIVLLVQILLLSGCVGVNPSDRLSGPVASSAPVPPRSFGDGLRSILRENASWATMVNVTAGACTAFEIVVNSTWREPARYQLEPKLSSADTGLIWLNATDEVLLVEPGASHATHATICAASGSTSRSTSFDLALKTDVPAVGSTFGVRVLAAPST